ncbi:MAG TPA: class I SAM-dependent methyltransferase [Patescibacteria group bacterium]
MQQTWKDYFAYEYLDDHAGYFSKERTEQELDFLTKNIIPTKTTTILDLACGQGRHSIGLTQRGYSHITGVDRDEHLLSLAYQAAAKATVTIPFIQQDMRHLNLDQTYDVIMLLFCTFGIESDEVNKDILKRLHAHLKPGGRIFFDMHNLFRFARRMKTQKNDYAEFDLETLTLWDINADGNRELPLRLYTVPEFTERLAKVGLTITKIWGDYDASPYSFDSERLLVLAQKA